MAMISHRVIEGTGAEVAEFAKQHPSDRFKLIHVNGDASESENWAGPDTETWDKTFAFSHSYKGRLPVLPPDATLTESLYD